MCACLLGAARLSPILSGRPAFLVRSGRKRNGPLRREETQPEYSIVKAERRERDDIPVLHLRQISRSNQVSRQRITGFSPSHSTGSQTYRPSIGSFGRH